jgi:hypothetical protein
MESNTEDYRVHYIVINAEASSSCARSVVAQYLRSSANMCSARRVRPGCEDALGMNPVRYCSEELSLHISFGAAATVHAVVERVDG